MAEYWTHFLEVGLKMARLRVWILRIWVICLFVSWKPDSLHNRQVGHRHRISVTRLVNSWKFLVANLVTKVAQIYCDILSIFGKHQLWSKSHCFGYFLGSFWKKNWLLFTPTSGHTGWLTDAVTTAERERIKLPQNNNSRLCHKQFILRSKLTSTNFALKYFT